METKMRYLIPFNIEGFSVEYIYEILSSSNVLAPLFSPLRVFLRLSQSYTNLALTKDSTASERLLADPEVAPTAFFDASVLAL